MLENLKAKIAAVVKGKLPVKCQVFEEVMREITLQIATMEAKLNSSAKFQDLHKDEQLVDDLEDLNDHLWGMFYEFDADLSPMVRGLLPRGVTTTELKKIAPILGNLWRFYDEVTGTAQELDPQCPSISLREAQQAILSLSLNQIRQIAKFKYPMLLLVPGNSFADKVKAINANKHYVSIHGQKNMSDVDVSEGAKSPFQDWQNWPAAGGVSLVIVDVDTRSINRNTTTENGQNNKRYSKNFAKQEMSLLTPDQYLVMMQRIFRMYDFESRTGITTNEWRSMTVPNNRIHADIPVALSQDDLFQHNEADRGLTLAAVNFDKVIKFTFANSNLIDYDTGTAFIPAIEVMKMP